MKTWIRWESISEELMNETVCAKIDNVMLQIAVDTMIRLNPTRQLAELLQ
jgi:hypothetical protein